MPRYHGLLPVLLLFSSLTSAEEEFTPTARDRQVIVSATLDYHQCLQENAFREIDNHSDIREITAQAIHLCEYRITELGTALGLEAGSESYNGLERRIKGRAIRKLLPVLMHGKSQRQRAAGGG